MYLYKVDVSSIKTCVNLYRTIEHNVRKRVDKIHCFKMHSGSQCRFVKCLESNAMPSMKCMFLNTTEQIQKKNFKISWKSARNI